MRDNRGVSAASVTAIKNDCVVPLLLTSSGDDEFDHDIVIIVVVYSHTS